MNDIAELCNGSTPVSGTVCLGSNPSSAATSPAVMRDLFFAVFRRKYTDPYKKVPSVYEIAYF